MSPTLRIGEDTKRAINELGNTFDSADDVLKRLLHEAGHGDLLQQEPSDVSQNLTEAEKADEGGAESNPVEVESEVPPPFYEFVLDWDWPTPLKQGSDQSKNVAGVVYRMMAQDRFNKEGYNWAVEHRAEEARREDRSRGEKYEWTVRDSCVRGLGFSGDGATKKFRDEAKMLTRKYKKEYR